MTTLPRRRALAAASAVAFLAILGVTALPSASADIAVPTVSPTDSPSSVAPSASSPSSSATPSDLFAGLGPIPTDPTKVEAYRAELRKRIVWATERRKSADEAYESASKEASQASHAAVTAEQRAADARDRLTLWTAYLYRVSGNAGMLSILNDPKADPAEFLRGTADATAFSESFIRDVKTAHDSAIDASNASAAASNLRDLAMSKAGEAEAARQFLVELLGPAQQLSAPVAASASVTTTTAPASAGATGPQTLVDGRACPTKAPDNTLRDGSSDKGILALCQSAVAQAATPQAALAIQAAFQMLGAPYACGGVGRQDAFRFDCSSLVSRAYFLGAGIDTAGKTWAPSTRDMVPWDGVPLAWWASYVSPENIRPGDIVLYDTGGAAYRHVVMYIGNGYMLHTNACGDVAHVSSFWGFEATGHHAFLVARRVIAPGGYRVPDPRPIPTTGPIPTPSPGATDPGAGDPKVVVPLPPTPSPKPTPTPTTPTPTPTSTSPSGSPSSPTSSPSSSPSSSPTSSSPSPSPSGSSTPSPSTTLDPSGSASPTP